MKVAHLRSFTTIACLLAFCGCTQLRPVPVPTTSIDPAAASPAVDESPVPFPSESPSPTPEPTPTPPPGPTITLVGPTATTDFSANEVDISFTLVAAPGRTVAGAVVSYDGAVIGTLEGAGPAFKIEKWNPNLLNSKAEPPNTTPVLSGDHTLTIVAKDNEGKEGKIEFGFRKQLRITGWTEQANMPNATSHMSIFSDGASPPAFLTLWGSIDGIESTVQPRSQFYGFNPAGNGSWTEVNVNGSSVPRAGYGATGHPSGQLFYMVGGRRGVQDLRTLELFSPLRKVAEQSLATMTSARRDAAVVFVENVLYAIGGKAGTTALYSVEGVKIGEDGNPVGNWEAKTDLINARSGANAVVQGKEIWVFGGGFRPIEIYDTVTNTWKFMTGVDGTTIGTPEAWFNSLMIPVGDRLFFFGGEKEDGQAITVIYEFNPITKAWREVGNLPEIEGENPTARSETRMAGFFLDRSFYIVGGKSLPDNQLSKRVFKGNTQ